MNNPIDEFLHSERQGGSISGEGSFSINLREAARKMALFGQTKQEAWTLKFGQAFYRLGCKELEISRMQDYWRLDGRGASRKLSLSTLKQCLSKLGLGGEQQAEDFLAVGLSALSVPTSEGKALEAACWVEDFVSEPLFGEWEGGSEEVQGPTLFLRFSKDASPPLPRSLWENGFAYSTMAVFYKTGASSRIHLNNSYSTQVMVSGSGLLWLEYLGRGSEVQDLALIPTGKSRASLGEKISSPVALLTTSQLQWKGVAQDRKRSIVLLARNELKGPTQIFPVVAGCLLQPVVAPGLCEGFQIVVTADECPTDLGHNQLRESPQLTSLIDSCKPPLQHALELMSSTVSNEDQKRTVVDKPKTPLVADVAPSCMGFFLVFTVPLAIVEPLTGTLLSLFFGGPPGLYFWYSRKQRNREFEELKYVASRVLNSRMQELSPADRERLPKSSPIE